MKLADAETMLSLYIDAEKAVLTSKAYEFRGRQVTREDLDEIRKGRKEWERKVSSLKSGRGIRVSRISPR